MQDRAVGLPAGSTGLRRSEMIALTLMDVNTVNLEVTVLRAFSQNQVEGSFDATINFFPTIEFSRGRRMV